MEIQNNKENGEIIKFIIERARNKRLRELYPTAEEIVKDLNEVKK